MAKKEFEKMIGHVTGQNEGITIPMRDIVIEGIESGLSMKDSIKNVQVIYGLNRKEMKDLQNSVKATVLTRIRELSNELTRADLTFEEKKVIGETIKCLAESDKSLKSGFIEIAKAIGPALVSALATIGSVSLVLLIEHRFGPRVGNRDAMNFVNKPRF